MSIDNEVYGPWIQHDGSGFPRAIFEDAVSTGASVVERVFCSVGRNKTPWEQANVGILDIHHPGWTWRKKFGFFGWWVARDDKYSRILRYRFIFPPGAKKNKSASVKMLKDIAALSKAIEEMDTVDPAPTDR